MLWVNGPRFFIWRNNPEVNHSLEIPIRNQKSGTPKHRPFQTTRGPGNLFMMLRKQNNLSFQLQLLSDHVHRWQDITESFNEKLCNAEKSSCEKVSHHLRIFFRSLRQILYFGTQVFGFYSFYYCISEYYLVFKCLIFMDFKILFGTSNVSFLWFSEYYLVLNVSFYGH